MAKRKTAKPQRKKDIELSRRAGIIGLSGVLMCAIMLLGLSTRGRQIAHALSATYSVDDPQFMRGVNALVGHPLVPGNAVTALQNGDETFTAMLDAISHATQSITFESSYFRKGTMTQRFAEALAERGRAGVKVHVLLDWAGTAKMDRSDLDLMREAGAEVTIYHKPHFWSPGRSYNRSHRRILVVDGRVGFTGGICVADEWAGHAQDKDHWRDTQFRVEGPVVAQMQAAFMDNWRESRGTVLHGDRYFPPLVAAGTIPVQVVTSSPDEGSENVRLIYLLSIASARSSIVIQNPYFVPDDVMIDALLAARARGVSIEIMLPGPVMDARMTKKASHSRFGRLLEAGIRIYEYQPTMLHMKIMVVDSTWVTAGSANFDNRSFRLNDEINIDVYDAAFARHLIDVFRLDQAHTREYTLADWRARSIPERLFESFAGLFRAQL